MKNLVADIYFEKLKHRNPTSVCNEINCKYDRNKKCYILSVWWDDYAIFPDEKTIKRLTSSLPQHHPFLDVFIMYYICNFKKNNLTNKWMSEKEMPGGSTFFRGPHKIPTELISGKYLNNLEEFKSKCKQLKGAPIDFADSAYTFIITPYITIAVAYWTGDDTFPAVSKLLFDRSLNNYLTLDIIFSLATDVCHRFAAI